MVDALARGLWTGLARGLLITALLLGCRKTPEVIPGPVRPADYVLELARARLTPNVAQARFGIRIRSRVLDLAGSTGGAFVMERPGKLNFAILSPLGGPIVQAVSDNQGLVVLVAKDSKALTAPDAASVLQGLSGGSAGLDDLVAVLIGDLPFDDAKVTRKKRLPNGDAEVGFVGPDKTVVDAVLNPLDGSPRSLKAYGPKGQLILEATYGAFVDQGGQRVPETVAVFVPQLDLTIDLRYKSWKYEESPAQAFSLVPPAGYTPEPLQVLLQKAIDKLATLPKVAPEDPPEDPAADPVPAPVP